MTIINAVAGAGDEAKLVSIDNAVTEFPQTFSPPTGYDGLASVTVQAPANFKASNIKKDVEIAGVTGTYEGSATNEKLVARCDGTLTDLTLSDLDGLTSVTDSAFYRLKSLKSVVLPDTVTSIGDYAFMYSSVESVDIPYGVTSIGKGCFSYTKLTEIIIPDSVTTIGYEAYSQCASVRKLTLSNSLTTIPSYCFYGLQMVQSIIIPEGVESIDVYAFASHYYLNTLQLPTTLRKIGNGAFQSGSYLTAVDIPEGVESIGDWAFSGNSALKNVAISSTVSSVGSRCFDNCSQLVSLTMMPTTPPTLGTYAFNGDTKMVITVPKGTLEAYKSATNWSEYADKMVEAEE